jgi:phenylpropionate dioxygenase-like ring-hydroxylating dioxygenase large terminal subunit
MSDQTITNDEFDKLVEQRISLGVKNLWYPILPSWGVKNTPVGITRLGEKIAVWRDNDGNVHAISDSCPHRGARMSLGINKGDKLACWYHGIEVDKDGMVVNVPAVDNCPMEHTKKNHSYPIQEIQGAIFAYFGDELNPEPVALELPDELVKEEYSSFLCTAIWKTSYRYAIDNVMDPMHGAYLHGDSHTMAWGEKKAKMRLEKTKNGWLFEKEGQTGMNFDWVEFGDTGTHWLRLAIPYQKKVGPGGNFAIIGFATPIDENTCQVYFWRVREVAGWIKDLWHFMYKNRTEGRHWDVLEQDRVLLEALDPDARDNEFLYQHDLGVSRIRFEIAKAARVQVKALMDHKKQNVQVGLHSQSE